MKMFGVEIIPLKFDYNCVVKYRNRCTERYVEIPIALAFIQNVVGSEDFLELGCTCPYYFKTLKNHTIYDLSDEHPDNIKKDIRTLSDSDYQTSIVSISTLEHVNRQEYGIDIVKDSFSGVDVLKKIVSNSPKYLVTIPIGQNAELDDFLLSESCTVGRKFVGRKPLKTDDWDLLDLSEVVGEYRQNNTYQNANCICVVSNSF